MLQVSRFQENQTVVCSDSTLCHLWRVPTFNPVSPVNFDCVVGGTVIDVHKMFLNQYRNCESTLNVIACCGLNNIPYKTARETITQMFCFQYSIHSMNKRSKVVFCSLPYPPKFCDTSVPNHLELIEKIETINKWIANFNEKETGLSFDLSKWGVEGDILSTTELKLKYGDWKENDIRKKLHLSHHIKKSLQLRLMIFVRH